jgi:flagellar basal body-associated protein FliL
MYNISTSKTTINQLNTEIEPTPENTADRLQIPALNYFTVALGLHKRDKKIKEQGGKKSRAIAQAISCRLPTVAAWV